MDNKTAFQLGQFNFWHFGEFALLGLTNYIPGSEYFDWHNYDSDSIYDGSLLYGKLRLEEISTIINKRCYILGRLNRKDVFSEFGTIRIGYDGQHRFMNFLISCLFDVIIDKFGPEEVFTVKLYQGEFVVVEVQASERVINYLYGAP